MCSDPLDMSLMDMPVHCFLVFSITKALMNVLDDLESLVIHIKFRRSLLSFVQSHMDFKRDIVEPVDQFG